MPKITDLPLHEGELAENSVMVVVEPDKIDPADRTQKIPITTLTTILNPLATTETPGAMSAEDKAKLDNLSSSVKGAARLTVAVIGASISQHYALDQSWPHQLKKAMDNMGLPVDIKNWAIHEHTFYTALHMDTVHESGTRSQVDQCIAQGADIVFVMLGVNDCIWVDQRTEAQVIQDGIEVYSTLKAGLPDAQIVLIEEAAHNFELRGYVPNSLTNADVGPAMHNYLTYLGLYPCRVNNIDFYNNPVTSTQLEKHQSWGRMVNTLRTVYDTSFVVNLWKIARMGCNIDLIHPGPFGHMWIAFTVLKWLANNNNIDNNVLNHNDLFHNTYFNSLDTYFNDVLSPTYSYHAQAVANYAQFNIFEKRSHWVFFERNLTFKITPFNIASGLDSISISIKGAEPGRPVYWSWGGAALTHTGKYTNDEGNFEDNWRPNQIIGAIEPGTYKLCYAVMSSYNLYDVYEQAIGVGASYAHTGPPLFLSQLETTLSNSSDKIPSSAAVQAAITSGGGGSIISGSAALTIAVLGDSLSQHFAFDECWPVQLKKAMDNMGLNVNMKNWAVNGYTFYDALYNTGAHESGTKSQVQQCIDQGADIVLVMLGINDSLYVNTRTEAQIIQDGVEVYSTLKAGLPNAQIVLINEMPHDFESKGMVPTSLTNADVTPASHNYITHHGLTFCRVNTSGFYSTSITPTQLGKHQSLGRIYNSLNSVYDSYTIVNLWKIARMGCNIDLIHPGPFGHMWVAFTILKWIADNNTVDNKVLNHQDLRLYNYHFSIDGFFAEAMSGVFSNAAIALTEFANYDIREREPNWLFQQRNLSVTFSPTSAVSGLDNVVIFIQGAEPNRPIHFSWNGGTFLNINKSTTHEGNFADCWRPNVIFGSVSPGWYKICYAIHLTSGVYDVFETWLNIANAYAHSGPPLLTSQIDTTVSTSSTKVPSSAAVYNAINSGSSGTTSSLFSGGVAKITAQTSKLVVPNGIALELGSSGGTNSINVFGYASISANLYMNGVIFQQVNSGTNSFAAPISCTGTITSVGGFTGSAGGTGASTALRDGGGYLSVKWSASGLQFFVNNTLVKTI